MSSAFVGNSAPDYSSLGGGGSPTTDASDLTSGTLDDARLSANVTLAGNTFNGASQLVQLDAGGAMPNIDGNSLILSAFHDSIVPDAPSSRDLGSEAKPWANIWGGFLRGDGSGLTNVDDAPYTPPSATDWNGSAPTSIADALNRIAAALGPIP
jgi:hypothetical protein